MDVTIVSSGQRPNEVDRLLRGLPEWFGIEQSIRGHVDAALDPPEHVRSPR